MYSCIDCKYCYFEDLDKEVDIVDAPYEADTCFALCIAEQRVPESGRDILKPRKDWAYNLGEFDLIEHSATSCPCFTKDLPTYIRDWKNRLEG